MTKKITQLVTNSLNQINYIWTVYFESGVSPILKKYESMSVLANTVYTNTGQPVKIL